MTKCPFGINARFCKHQETRAKDLLSAAQGDLAFFCLLSDLTQCPKVKAIINEGMPEETKDV